jgi:putative membrane protein
MTKVQRFGWLAVWAVLALSAVHAPFPEQLKLQHIPTVIALAGWPFLARRYPVSNSAAACLGGFLLLHIIAARHIYSYVPYDDWTQLLVGVDVTSTFGLRRNHFDRLVHFSFGLLFVRPMWEACSRYLRIPRRVAYYVAFEFVLAFSMVYELLEWGLSLVLAGPDADSYNGQQGDAWDAQKDMCFALVGAAVSLLILFSTRRQRAILMPTESARPEHD